MNLTSNKKQNKKKTNYQHNIKIIYIFTFYNIYEFHYFGV